MINTIIRGDCIEAMAALLPGRALRAFAPRAWSLGQGVTIPHAAKRGNLRTGSPAPPLPSRAA